MATDYETSDRKGDTAPLKISQHDTLKPNLGMDDESLSGAVRILTPLLADEFVFYTMLRKYHWNVTGAHFYPLHTAFEEQYTAIEGVIDDLAERIRQYGDVAIGTLKEFSERTRLEEQPGVNPSEKQMVIDIMETHETMVRFLREAIDAADDMDDIGTEDFLTGLLQQHQKWAWMLRATAEGM